jgi:acetyl esterase
MTIAEVSPTTAKVDSEAQAVLDLIAASGRAPLQEMSIAEARLAVRGSQDYFGKARPPSRVRDSAFAGPQCTVPLRIYRPGDVPDDTVLPAMLFLHGGGWMLGDLDYGGWFCGALAGQLGIAVIAVGYRLAPEHPFPAGIEDCFAALDHVAGHAGALAIDPARMGIVGDSAGGNLAAATALHARDWEIALCSQILIYPVTALADETGSYGRNAAGFGLTAEAMRWFRAAYLAGADPEDWRASPLRAPRLDGVAPALVLTAGFDPLADEGDAYAIRLAGDGVPVRHLRYPGQIHNFVMWARSIGAAETALSQIVEELRSRLLA